MKKLYFTIYFTILSLMLPISAFANTVTLTPSSKGWARTYDNTVWANAQNDSTPNGVTSDFNSSNSFARTDFGLNCNGASDYCLYRSFTTFNTGSTTLQNATINSVKFQAIIASKTDNGGSVNLAESNWSGTMVGADFVKIMASPTSATMIATAKTIASITADSSTLNEWTLNATGLAYMNYGTNGTTSIAILSSADYTNTAPTNNNNVQAEVGASRVYLVIDYTPNSSTILPKANFIDFSINWIKKFIQNFV